MNYQNGLQDTCTLRSSNHVSLSSKFKVAHARDAMICYIQLDPNLKHKLCIFSRKYQRCNPFGTFMSAGGLLSVAGRTTKIWKIWVSNVIVYSWPANRRACFLLAECWNYLFPLRALRTSEDRKIVTARLTCNCADRRRDSPARLERNSGGYISNFQPKLENLRNHESMIFLQISMNMN
jgi:hypothetical protein